MLTRILCPSQQDWEYPNAQTSEGNVVSPADAANLLLFLQTLRSVAGINTRLSMAVPVSGVVGASGEVLTDMKAYAVVLDYLTVMSYDITGTWSGYTGPNSPWSAGCAPAGNPYSVYSGCVLSFLLLFLLFPLLRREYVRRA